MLHAQICIVYHILYKQSQIAVLGVWFGNKLFSVMLKFCYILLLLLQEIFVRTTFVVEKMN